MYFRAQGFTKEQKKVIRSELPILHYMSLGENVYMTLTQLVPALLRLAPVLLKLAPLLEVAVEMVQLYLATIYENEKFYLESTIKTAMFL